MHPFFKKYTKEQQTHKRVQSITSNQRNVHQSYHEMSYTSINYNGMKWVCPSGISTPVLVAEHFLVASYRLSINWWISKENILCINSGILFNHKRGKSYHVWQWEWNFWALSYIYERNQTEKNKHCMT